MAETSSVAATQTTVSGHRRNACTREGMPHAADARRLAATLLVRARHRVLLHAAAGGVGLVGVEYFHWLRTRVLGTAGRPHKHALLRNSGVAALCSSRDGGAFAAGVAVGLVRRSR